MVSFFGMAISADKYGKCRILLQVLRDLEKSQKREYDFIGNDRESASFFTFLQDDGMVLVSFEIISRCGF